MTMLVIGSLNLIHLGGKLIWSLVEFHHPNASKVAGLVFCIQLRLSYSIGSLNLLSAFWLVKLWLRLVLLFPLIVPINIRIVNRVGKERIWAGTIKKRSTTRWWWFKWQEKARNKVTFLVQCKRRCNESERSIWEIWKGFPTAKGSFPSQCYPLQHFQV